VHVEQVDARLDALDELLGASAPALAAALLPRLARDAAADWPCAPGWGLLRSCRGRVRAMSLQLTLPSFGGQTRRSC